MALDLSSYLLGKSKGGGGTPNLQSKDVTITQNGTTTITADSGYDGLSDVDVTTNVSGGSSPTNFDELNAICQSALISYDNYLKSMPNNYDVYTQNSITLYTPAETHKNYVIAYRNGKYKGYWIRNSFIELTNTTRAYIRNIAYSNATAPSGTTYIQSMAKYVSNNLGQASYETQEYSTLEECIEAMSSSQTTYNTTSSQYINYQAISQNVYLPYSNMPVLSAIEGVTNTGVKRLSQNETINVIE